MSESLATTVVIADTNVLINFVHIGQISLLGTLPTFRIGLPVEVLTELANADQRRLIEDEIVSNNIDLLSIEDIDALVQPLTVQSRIGGGEAIVQAVDTAFEFEHALGISETHFSLVSDGQDGDEPLVEVVANHITAVTEIDDPLTEIMIQVVNKSA